MRNRDRGNTDIQLNPVTLPSSTYIEMLRLVILPVVAKYPFSVLFLGVVVITGLTIGVIHLQVSKM